MATISQTRFESRVLSLESGGTVIKQINLALLAVAKDRDGGEEKKEIESSLGPLTKIGSLRKQNWSGCQSKREH